jgi:hypothetical protein
VIGVPLQVPLVQTSPVVHFLPSLQVLPLRKVGSQNPANKTGCWLAMLGTQGVDAGGWGCWPAVHPASQLRSQLVPDS